MKKKDTTMSNPMPQPNVPLPPFPQSSGLPAGNVPTPDSQPGTVPMPQPVAVPQPASQNPPIDPTVQQYQPGYNTIPVQTSAAPVGQLYTQRSLVKWILLGIITLGIYNIVIMTGATDSLNTIASRYDGKKTMHYCLLYFLIAPITLGIASLVWYHKMSNRVGDELVRRGYERSVSATTYWLFCALPMFLAPWFLIAAFFIAPFGIASVACSALELVYYYKYLDAMNTLCADYNRRG
ncbi:DUF4234 domain-containing protein [Bifidobacterium sp. ESL0769]|uniref:DUF4234 domain-containing protein n=1 Tax=Bifidobacterium sp. ESL0769 TaxID=2983229 RepID=UPI0023F7C829|nr:DUF4234 domain-containing protein [Bifidobacterium sp. ESL0769]WEV66825.1 DUF4234 domain-containing protein [Bifidobacterium sp. ESL0769]